jgi:hypothetical protein
MQDAEKKLKQGKMKVSQGVEIAKQSLRARGDWMVLTMQKSNILNNSADSLAGNHRFNYLVSTCTVYDDDNSPVFKDYNDFLTEDNKGSIVPTIAGQNMSKLLYNMDEDFRKDWFEYKFLLKYKAVDAKLNFVDKDGNVVDIDGNPIIKPENKPAESEPEFYPDDVEETPVSV